MELHIYSNETLGTPTGKTYLAECTPKQDLSLKSDSCLKTNPYRKVFATITRTNEFKKRPGDLVDLRTKWFWV